MSANLLNVTELVNSELWDAENLIIGLSYFKKASRSSVRPSFLGEQ